MVFNFIGTNKLYNDQISNSNFIAIAKMHDINRFIIDVSDHPNMDKFPVITNKLKVLAKSILDDLDSEYFSGFNIIAIRIMDITSTEVDSLLEYNRLRNLLDLSSVDLQE